MLFLFYIFFLVLLILLLILSMKIQIKIKNLKYNSENKSHINKEYSVILYIYILNQIKIFRFKFTKEKFHKLNEKTHIKEKIEKEMKERNLKKLAEKYDVTKDFKEIVKNIKIKTSKLDFSLELGTKNLLLTSFLIPTISTIIAFILYKIGNKKEKQNFKIIPVYQNKNLIFF